MKGYEQGVSTYTHEINRFCADQSVHESPFRLPLPAPIKPVKPCYNLKIKAVWQSSPKLRGCGIRIFSARYLRRF
jgi:hypothetical protein